jgi:beta-mannosidase
MRILTLDGKWTLQKAGSNKRMQASVPGCVHTDLIATGEIPEPFFRDNETAVQWVSEVDWIYSRDFDVPSEILAHDSILLRCNGLDTLAEIRINGNLVGNTDNMFRTWEFDAKKFLRSGRNVISVCFGSVIPYIEEQCRNTPRKLNEWKNEKAIGGAHWIRKEPCNFGWDWGPTLVTCGIWRSIELTAFDTARISDAHIVQQHGAGRVKLAVQTNVQKLHRTQLTLSVTASFNGHVVASQKQLLLGRQAEVGIEIGNPHLWWPNGIGDQPLYEITVDLLDQDGELLDTKTKRIGLRTLELVRKKDKWGESFCFAANGVRFFAKGANWIPADAFAARVTPDQYRDLLQSAADAHMNFIRVWGGGTYESGVFYDICDELGICVWQDFMFSCTTYPVLDDAFMQNVKAEAEDNVRRLRHHPCIALWCGNNELEQGLVGPKWNDWQMSWKDYGKLFDKLLPSVVRRLDPDRPYWPCSPHKPHGKREEFANPKWGDAHLWDVWHGLKPFEWYRTTYHRFVSEFGFQSFPEPKTVRGYTIPSDKNITSRIMEHHQRSGIGNAAIMHYLLDWFRLPKNFDMTLWLSQILQGMAIKYAVEHWRRNMPQCMGAIYWQLNDTWPVASWSSIDYHGRWKALHYLARRFYAPVLVSGVENSQTGTVDIHVTNDLLKALHGRVNWTMTTVAGKKLCDGTFGVVIPPCTSKKVKTLDISSPLSHMGSREVLVWLELESRNVPLLSNLVLFGRPKHFDLEKPDITTNVKPLTNNTFAVSLKAKKTAFYVWLETMGRETRFSDNFFHIRPGNSTTITATISERCTTRQLKKALRVRSLVDTY